MKDNKLIAEFMGRGGTFNHDKTMICTGIFPDTMTLMKYHTSWDWLMPVLSKILDLSFQDDGDAEDFYSIRDCVPDINHTHKAVVEFIKTYNDER